jgi:hypothetical protein
VTSQTLHLEVSQRLYNMLEAIDQQLHLRKYAALVRQLFVKNLGYDQPTVLLTNDAQATRAALTLRHARRMVTRNGLADAVNFLHLDDLSSAVACDVNVDV